MPTTVLNPEITDIIDPVDAREAIAEAERDAQDNAETPLNTLNSSQNASNSRFYCEIGSG